MIGYTGKIRNVTVYDGMKVLYDIPDNKQIFKMKLSDYDMKESKNIEKAK